MVIVLDKHKKPAGFITERRARKLMEAKRACLYRTFPAIVILKDKCAREMDSLLSYRIKIDPGSVHTGIAILCNETGEVVFYQQIEHRGHIVHKNKQAQKNARRNRRSRETWYREPGFEAGQEYTSGREEGWLPPSVKSVADNIIHWVEKLRRWINITECSFEAVRFDTQLMDNPDIEGVEYQHGELFGYEVKAYLLDRYGHECQYCKGASGDTVLEWEHKIPKSRGGSDKISNATLSCCRCNRDKGDKLPKEWLESLEASPAAGILKQKINAGEKLTKEEELLKARLSMIQNVIEGKNTTSNRYCAWVNSTRRYTEGFLFNEFGKVECSSGGKTKYNREKILKLPKDHHYDALSVGSIPADGYKDRTGGYVLMTKAMGRGSRLRGLINTCGVIVVKFYDSTKRVHGFQTGDIVRAVIPAERSKYGGTYVGRITIRHTGTFGFKPFGKEKKFDVNYKYLKKLQCTDGYEYEYAKP